MLDDSLFVFHNSNICILKSVNAGADPETFERGGVGLNLAFEVARKSIIRASKWQRLEVSILIRADFSNLQLILLFDIL